MKRLVLILTLLAIVSVVYSQAYTEFHWKYKTASTEELKKWIPMVERALEEKERNVNGKRSDRRLGGLAYKLDIESIKGMREDIELMKAELRKRNVAVDNTNESNTSQADAYQKVIDNLNSIKAEDFIEVPPFEYSQHNNGYQASTYAEKERARNRTKLLMKKSNPNNIDQDKPFTPLNMKEGGSSKIESDDLRMIDLSRVKSVYEQEIESNIFSQFSQKYGIQIEKTLKKETLTKNDFVVLKKYRDFTDSLLAVDDKKKDMAVLSLICYRDNDKKMMYETGYRTVYLDNISSDSQIYPLAEQIQNFNLQMSSYDFQDFHAELYYNKRTNQYTVAFEGTNSMKGAMTDGIQGVGLVSEQYKMAIAVGKQIKQITDKNKDFKINLTGHSLGGGLATIAGVVSGQPTYVFNPAGVHENTFKDANVLRNIKKDKYNINVYSSKNDVLTNLQESKGKWKGINVTLHAIDWSVRQITVPASPINSVKDLPIAVGNKEVINHGIDSPFGAHSMIPFTEHIIAHNRCIHKVIKQQFDTISEMYY